MKLFRYLLGQCCLFCGKTVEVGSPYDLCRECSEKLAENKVELSPHSFPDSVSLFRFEDPLRRALHRFKYRGNRQMGIYCGERLAEYYLRTDHRADVVTCVPRAKDGLPRMYNQSWVIAKAMAKKLNLPLDGKLLSKRSGGLTQIQCPTTLARERNAQKLYRTGPSKRDLTGKRVLLVDDLYTTGATARVCSHLLKTRGAEEVYIYTALRADQRDSLMLCLNFDRDLYHEEFGDNSAYLRTYRKMKRNGKSKIK